MAKTKKQAQTQIREPRPCEPSQEWKNKFCGGKTLGDLIQERLDAIEIQAKTIAEQ